MRSSSLSASTGGWAAAGRKRQNKMYIIIYLEVKFHPCWRRPRQPVCTMYSTDDRVYLLISRRLPPSQAPGGRGVKRILFFCWFGRCSFSCCWLVGLLNKSKVCRHQINTLPGTCTLHLRTVDAGLVFFFPFPFLPPVTLPHSPWN